MSICEHVLMRKKIEKKSSGDVFLHVYRAESQMVA